MDLASLERALSAAEARPVLADSRLVRRVIKRHRRLPGFGLQVPHARCYAIGRAALLDIVSVAELGRSAADLPDDVILLPRPDPEDLARTPAPTLLTNLWRYAFHARVHLEIERRAADGRLTEARLRERIHRLGQTEVDEMRLVLRQDDLLLPPHEDLDTYAELAALYLELSRFAPHLLRETFPALDRRTAEEVIAEDVDVERLLAACRPDGAPDKPALIEAPVDEPAAPEPAPETHEEEKPTGNLRGEAEEARRRGNVVRSALSQLRLATHGGGDAALVEARADLAALARRLDDALRGSESAHAIDVRAWEALLVALAQRAARRGIFRWMEARLLFDLQRACLASEKAIGKVDLIDWTLSLGKRPLARLLPATRPIRVARELASAAKKVSRVGLPEADRARLGELLAAARRRADDNIRAALRPVVLDALAEVGLRPEGVPERVALHKVVEDLLDQATARGHIGLGVLRDALSRNQLKLADLSGPRELFAGDALLLADQRLAQALDGVHARGEIYLRFLQKLSSLLFGTGPSRVITRYLLLPTVSAFVLLEGVNHIVNPIGHAAKLIPRGHHLHLLTPVSFLVTSAVIFGLIHSAVIRGGALAAARACGTALAAVFWHAPRWLLARPLVRLVLGSRAVFVLRRFVLKPAAIAAALVLFTPLRIDPSLKTLAAGSSAFVVSNLVLNSRTGALIEEITLDALARTWRRLRRHVLPGLFRLVADTFRRITDAVDRGIYAVDEFLRFREGQSRALLAAKAVLGVFWFAIAYVVRIYINLLIEPQVNPIKHFPVVTVAAKIITPLSPTLIPALHDLLARPFGNFVANALAAPTILLLPGVAGFLAWEFKENYKLYRATRAAHLAPVPIGHHGETMGALLKPGFHSGTLPKAWAKLRRAAKKGDPSMEKHHEAMREIEEVVERFAERELVALLEASPAWKGGDIRVGHVELASNRVRILLARAKGEAKMVIAFEEQSGWLVASVPELGWAADLSPTDHTLLENALGGFYQLAGVELVREQIAAALPDNAPYDVSDEGLVVWPDGWATELIYPLDGRGPLTAKARGEPPKTAPTSIDPARILFQKQPIAWADWVAAWSTDVPERVSKGAPLLGSSDLDSRRALRCVGSHG